jgi:hypothetical protein
VQRTLGPAFFHEVINPEFYVKFIFSPFFSQLTGEGKLYVQFMQDNVVTHTANNSVDALDKVFWQTSYKLRTVTSVITQ